MERLETVRARIGTIAQLQEVVTAMRSLAAMRMQQAGEMLAGARRYAGIVETALAQGFALAGGLPPPPTTRPRRAVLVFSAEHGFVGFYAEALAEATQAAAADLVLAVGSKGAQALAETGQRVDWTLPMASHAGGLPEIARQIADEIGRRLDAGDITHLDAIFGQVREGAGWQVARRTLLPADPARFRRESGRSAPLHHLPVADLLARLIGEQILADLMLAATESLTAENSARLVAMTTAGDNIERKLAELRASERVLRQEQITEELLDVVNGAELLFTGQRTA